MVRSNAESPVYKTTSFRAESSLTEEAREVFEAEGLSVSAAITLFLEACATQGRIPNFAATPETVPPADLLADGLLRSTAIQLRLSDFDDPKIPTKKFVDDVVSEFTDSIFKDCLDPWIALGGRVLSLSFRGLTTGRVSEPDILYGSLEDYLPEKLPYDYAERIVRNVTEEWVQAEKSPSSLTKDPHSAIMGRILKRSRLTLDGLMRALVEAGVVDGPEGDSFNRSLGKMVESIVLRLKKNLHWDAPNRKCGVPFVDADPALVERVVGGCAESLANVDYTKYLAFDHPLSVLFENVSCEMTEFIGERYFNLYDSEDERVQEILLDLLTSCEFSHPPKVVYDESAKRYVEAMESAEPGSVAAKCLSYAKAPFDPEKDHLYSSAIDMDAQLWLDLYNREAFGSICREIAAGNLPKPQRQAGDCEMSEEDDGLPEGMHRGCLAGLSEEERAKVREKHFEDSCMPDELILSTLVSRAIKCASKSSLVDVLSLECADQLIELAEELGIAEDLAGLDESEMARVIADAMISGKAQIAADVEERHTFSRKWLKRVLSEGGSISFSADNEEDLKAYQGMNACWPYANMFLDKGIFTLKVPDELFPLLKALDWEGIDARYAAWKDAIHCADVCSDFYGIVPVAYVYDQYLRWYGHSVSRVEFMGFILDARVQGETDFYIVELWDPYNMDCTHLASYKLLDSIIGIDEFVVEEELVTREEYLDYLVQRQFCIPRCPMPDALRDQTAFEWKMSLPATVPFRNYLDAHVPDGDNDYSYAEKIIEGILFEDGPLFENIDGAEYINRLGLAYDDESFDMAYGLWRGMMASLPCWETHGWSYVEFLKMERELIGEDDDEFDFI